MNTVQEIAAKRLEEIRYASNRINAKLKANPNHPRADDLRKRLSQYERSIRALNLELKTGTPVKIKDAKQQALIDAIESGEEIPSPTTGVTVNVPAGSMNMEGQ